MINVSDTENMKKLIELEKISLTSTLEIQKNLNKQILMFIKNFMSDVTFSYDINPNDRAFYYLNESTNALTKSNSNITILKNLLSSLEKINDHIENSEEQIHAYNQSFQDHINSIYESTEIIENFVHRITTIDLSELAQSLTVKSEEKPENIIDNDDFSNFYFENTLIISELQQKVFLPFTINNVKEILLSNRNEYTSIQNVIDKLYTRPIADYKFPAIARFREAYKLIKDKENGSTLKALGLGFELFFNYNLHPAIITACKSSDELDVYLACLEDNTLNDFLFFDIKYQIPPAVIHPSKNTVS